MISNGAKVWIYLESAKCFLGLLCVDIQQDKTRKDKVRQGFFLPTNLGKTRSDKVRHFKSMKCHNTEVKR